MHKGEIWSPASAVSHAYVQSRGSSHYFEIWQLAGLPVFFQLRSKKDSFPSRGVESLLRPLASLLVGENGKRRGRHCSRKL